MASNQFYPTARAAERLGVSSSFLCKLRCTGGGPPFIKVGRRVLYSERDLETWAASRRRTSTSCECRKDR